MIDSRPTLADRYLAAVRALLMAMATDSTIDDETLDALLDAMPDVDLRDGLRVWLGEAGLVAKDAGLPQSPMDAGQWYARWTAKIGEAMKPPAEPAPDLREGRRDYCPLRDSRRAP